MPSTPSDDVKPLHQIASKETESATKVSLTWTQVLGSIGAGFAAASTGVCVTYTAVTVQQFESESDPKLQMNLETASWFGKTSQSKDLQEAKTMILHVHTLYLLPSSNNISSSGHSYGSNWRLPVHKNRKAESSSTHVRPHYFVVDSDRNRLEPANTIRWENYQLNGCGWHDSMHW